MWQHCHMILITWLAVAAPHSTPHHFCCRQEQQAFICSFVYAALHMQIGGKAAPDWALLSIKRAPNCST